MYPNLSFEHYRKQPGINKSALDLFRKSAAHFRDYCDGRIPDADSDVLMFGRIAHAAVLENRTDWVLSPFDSFRTAEAREWRDAQTLPIIKESDANQIAEWVELVRSTKLATDLLAGCECEVSMFAEDESALRVKGRPDAVAPEYFVDLKFVRDASSRGFSRLIEEYGWHRQAAWYLRISELLGRKQQRFYFIAVEKSTPARINVVELNPGAIELGREDNDRDIVRLRSCISRNEWPGYCGGEIQQIDVPAWAHAQSENGPLSLTIGGASTTL